MEKSARYKAKNKKQPTPKPKTTKKRKSDGPTCSMFLTEITKRLNAKRRQEAEAPINIIQTIIDSITNALPIKISKRTPPKVASPIKIDQLQALAPELLPNDTLSVPYSRSTEQPDDTLLELAGASTSDRSGFKMPKMPVVNSEILKLAVEKRRRPLMVDVFTTTGGNIDAASEIAKHVGTLKKISLIAEEFNQKTAKNLKEIVDSVQEDLIKKLEEIQAEKKAQALAESQALALRLLERIDDSN